MAQTFKEFAQPKFTRDRAEKLAWLEIDVLRRRRRLTAGITVDFRNVIPRIGFGITANGMVVEDT